MNKQELIEFLEPFDDSIEIKPTKTGYHFSIGHEMEDGIGCIKLEIVKDRLVNLRGDEK